LLDSPLTDGVFFRTLTRMSPEEHQKMLDELEASRASRKRAWENLQEFRWVLKDVARIELPPPVRKTIDLKGRIVKDGVQLSRNVRRRSRILCTPSRNIGGFLTRHR
jgi:hypothetical protein